jgi:hypothetical protein
MAILAEAAKYKADHGGSRFVRPSPLSLDNRNIANDATTIVCVCAEAAHKSCLDNYASYEAAKRGIAKFLCDVVDDKIWYNDLKDAKISTQRLRPLRSWPTLTPTVGCCMPST